MNDENPLWKFAVEIYSREDVSEILLYAQDQFSIDVNMILYSAWLACENRSLSTRNVSEVENLVAAWRREVVLPIRCLRKSFRSIVGADLIREEVKKAEILAEMEQLKMMYNIFLETSSAEFEKSKADLLENNLRSLSEMGFDDEVILVRMKKILLEEMGWYIS